MQTNPVTEPILIVEDDPNDVLLLKLALKKNAMEGNVQIVNDGQEAIHYLQGNPPYDDRQKYPFPRLIYTDVKMRRRDGFDMLKWLRDNPDCAVIPVIILSASEQDSDIKKAYELGANAYLVKPSSLNDLAEMIHISMDFWRICQKPHVPSKC
jgi:CheY-like chemotaxis protein